MRQFRVQPGDIFLTASNQLFGRGIRFVERMFSLDRDAKYNHSGIILAGDGETLESLWTVKRQNLYRDYAGRPVLVARCNQVTQYGLEKAMQSVLSREGTFYPFLRIPLHVLGLAKWLHWKPVVCSELVVSFLDAATCETGCGEFRHWYGWTPDHLHDAVRTWRMFETVFDGVMEDKEVKGAPDA